MSNKPKLSPAEKMFGRWMRHHRESLGLTQTELAARLGVHCSAISNMETGLRSIRLGDAAKIVSVLGESIDSMVVGYLPNLEDELAVAQEKLEGVDLRLDHLQKEKVDLKDTIARLRERLADE
jgi:transcriptional regulator with XRE-family HTH domain